MRKRIAIILVPSLAALPLAAQQVTLPLTQFEELRAKADPRPEKPSAPPAPFALETAELDVQAGAASARLTTTLVLTLYADGWQTIPVGEAGSFVAADWGGLEGRIDVVKDRGWVLAVRGKGRHSVRLTSVVEAVREESAARPTRRVNLVAPGAAVVTGTITVPADVEEVTLAGPGLLEPAGAGRWSLLAAPRAALSIALTGKRTTPERARLPLRFEATSATATKLSRTRLAVDGAIEVRVAQGRLPEIRVPVPAGFQVVAARGGVSGIAGWNVVEGTLVVTPLEPVENSLTVEVELTGEPKDSFAAPLLLVESSARTLHYAKATLSGDGLLALADPGSVRPAEEREAQRVSAAAQAIAAVPVPLLAVADPARPPRWQAEWAEKTEVLAAQIDRLVVDVVAGDTGRAAYQLWAEVRNRGAQQVTFTLPAGFELIEARRDGLAVAPGRSGPAAAPEDTRGLAVPLATGEAAQLIHLQGLLPLAVPATQGDLAVPLPMLSAPAARIEMRVVLPGGRSYTLAEPQRAGSVSIPQARGARRNVSKLAQQVNVYVSPDTVAGPSALLSPAGFGVLQAAWSALSDKPSPLVIRVRPLQEKRPWF